MLIVFTGNGKGKTTAALGQAVRMIGRGKRVLMIQFIKGPWKSGEDLLVKKLNVTSDKLKEGGREDLKEELQNLFDFQIKKMGLGFVGILGDTLPKEKHAEAAQKALQFATSEMRPSDPAQSKQGEPSFARSATAGTWDLIILDEINVATSLGLLTKEEVLDAVKDLPPEKFIIFTGRGAPQEFIDRADLVTEMREIKHPFNDGKMAKIAVEF